MPGYYDNVRRKHTRTTDPVRPAYDPRDVDPFSGQHPAVEDRDQADETFAAELAALDRAIEHGPPLPVPTCAPPLPRSPLRRDGQSLARIWEHEAAATLYPRPGQNGITSEPMDKDAA
jgi:hypothetical protein